MFDEESVVKALLGMFQDPTTGLNSNITRINNIKGDLPITPIDSDHYCFQTLTKAQRNFKGFFALYGVLPAKEEQVQQDNFLQRVNTEWWVGFFDGGSKSLDNKFYQLLRYRWALQQTILRNADVLQGFGKPLLGTLEPNALPISANRALIRIGITISASITAN